jgi:hypothetical protein
MDFPTAPGLKFLHTEDTLNRAKLEWFRRLSTDELKASLAPHQQGSLKARSDGTVLDGHHRIRVLAERGEDIHQFPREKIEKNDESRPFLDTRSLARTARHRDSSPWRGLA